MRNLLIGALAIGLGLIGCKNPDPVKGCTDRVAENFNYLAVEDDGSCIYTDTTIQLWNDGQFGFFGDQSTGGLILSTCAGVADTSRAFIDSTSLDLMIVSDTMGDFGFNLSIANKKSAENFKNGYLVFDAMLPKNSPLQYFDILMEGNNCFDINNCLHICQSGGVTITTYQLDTLMTKVVIPLNDFHGRKLTDFTNVMTLRQTAGKSDTVLVINNIRWTTMPETN